MKKILITGANSYIGMSFERYMKQWKEEYVVDTVDMIDGSWREKDLSGYDVVFHVAGIAHIKETKQNQDLYYKVNRDLAIEVAEKAKCNRIKQFIFLSSMSVYGMDTGVITKETVEKPTSAYGKSKLQAEQEIAKLQSEDFNICVLRPPMVYGKGCKGNYQQLNKVAKYSPLFPMYENKRSMIHIEKLCEYLNEIIDENKSGHIRPQDEKLVCTSIMVSNLAENVNHKLIFTKRFNRIIDCLKYFNIKYINKIFGDLYYED